MKYMDMNRKDFVMKFKRITDFKLSLGEGQIRKMGNHSIYREVVETFEKYFPLLEKVDEEKRKELEEKAIEELNEIEKKRPYDKPRYRLKIMGTMNKRYLKLEEL